MIVPVTEENAALWAELNVALWPDQSADEILDLWRADKKETEFLYYKGDEAVAFLSLSLRRDYVEGTDSSPVGYIEGIYVKPNYRGQGVARELIGFAKEWSVHHGCTEMASDCELSNEASRAFHNRAGFLEANTIVCFTMKLT